MDIWNATEKQIKEASLKYFKKSPIEILKQSGFWCYVYFNDGTSDTVYQWMIN